MHADSIYSRSKQYEGFRPVFTNQQCLKDSGNSEELTGELYCRFREDNSDTEHRASPLLDRYRVGLPARKRTPLTVSSHRNSFFEGCFSDPSSQDFADWNSQSKTFLDLDTQTLTSVGCTHLYASPDSCDQSARCYETKKRKTDSNCLIQNIY